MELMNKISSIGISAAAIAALLIFAAITNSLLAVAQMQSTPSNKLNQQMIMTQLFSGKTVKVGNLTIGLRPGVMVTPMVCTSISGNISGMSMFGKMMSRNMNQSSMMMGAGAQGNQTMGGLGAMMMHGGMIPSVCFSMSDAALFRSMMMHGGSMNGILGGNMTGMMAGNMSGGNMGGNK